MRLLLALFAVSAILLLPVGVRAEHCQGDHWTLARCGAGQCREANCGVTCEDVAGQIERINAQLRSLNEQARDLRTDLIAAQARRDAARDRIYGASGSAASFFKSIIDLAGAGTSGAVGKLGGYTKDALDAAGGNFGGVASTVQGELMDAAADARVRDASARAMEAYRSTGDAKAATQQFLAQARSARWIQEGMNVGKWLSFAKNVVDYARNTQTLADDIAEWFEAQGEVERLLAQLDRIDEEIQRLIDEKAALRDQCPGEGDDPPAIEADEPAGEPVAEAEDDEEGVPLEDEAVKGAFAEAAGLLGALGGHLGSTTVHIADNVFPPLAPFVSGDWQDMDPAILYELLVYLQPEVDALAADLEEALTQGRRIAALLGRAGGPDLLATVPEALELSIAAVADPDPAVGAEAVRALGRLGDAAALPVLAAALGDARRDVADAAVVALVDLGRFVPDVAPALVELARGAAADPASAAAASEALVALGDALGTGVRVSLDGLPGAEQPYAWFVTPAGAGPEARVTGVEQPRGEALPLAPGRYDLWWVQTYDHRNAPMRIAPDVELGTTGVTGVDVATGVAVEVAPWAPPIDATYGWWGAVQAGAAPDARVNWSASARALPVPPGRYDIWWTQGYEHRNAPIAMARDVEVTAGAAARLSLDSGVQLQPADWVPGPDGTYGWWGAVPAGRPPAERVHWTASDGALLLPPGTYDVYWVQDYATRNAPMLLAPGVVVEAGGPTVVEAASGVRLAIAEWVPQRDPTYGWWGAAPAGAGPEAPVNWTNTLDALLLPAGAYDIYWVQDYATRNRPLLLGRGVQVQAGELVTLEVASGIALRLPVDAPLLDATYGWWGLAPVDGAPGDRLVWSEGRSDLPLLAPPGTYDVYLKIDYESDPVRVAAAVEVAEGVLVEVGR